MGLRHTKYGSSGLPVPGYNIHIIDEHSHKEVKQGEEGQIVVKLPLPPGTLTTLYNNDTRYRESYLETYPGYYQTGDAGFFDEDGYLHVG